jgi:hypothetical protein
MTIENVEPIESAITFTVHSIALDNTTMTANADFTSATLYVFYPRGCIKFNPDGCCHLDLKVPLTNDHRER